MLIFPIGVVRPIIFPSVIYRVRSSSFSSFKHVQPYSVLYVKSYRVYVSNFILRHLFFVASRTRSHRYQEDFAPTYCQRAQVWYPRTVHTYILKYLPVLLKRIKFDWLKHISFVRSSIFSTRYKHNDRYAPIRVRISNVISWAVMARAVTIANDDCFRLIASNACGWKV